MVGFSELFGGQGGKDFHLASETTYESDVVQYLCTRYHLGAGEKAELLRWQQENYSEKRLSLAAFYAVFPTFPVRIVARKFADLPKRLTISKLFTDFGRQPFVDAMEQQEEAFGDQPLAVAFYWPYLKARAGTAGTPEPGGLRGLVVHNVALLESLPGVRLTWTAPSQAKLYLETLASLLRHLDHAKGRKWRPSDD